MSLSGNPNQTSFLFQICDYHFNFAGCGSSIDDFYTINTIGFTYSIILVILSFAFPVDILWKYFHPSSNQNSMLAPSSSSPSSKSGRRGGNQPTSQRGDLTRSIPFILALITCAKELAVCLYFASGRAINSLSILTLTNEGLLRNVQQNIVFTFLDATLGYVISALFIRHLMRAVIGSQFPTEEKRILAYLNIYYFFAAIVCLCPISYYVTVGVNNNLNSYITARSIFTLVDTFQLLTLGPGILILIQQRIIAIMKSSKREEEDDGLIVKLKKKIRRLKITVRDSCLMLVYAGLMRFGSYIFWQELMNNSASQVKISICMNVFWAIIQMHNVNMFFLPVFMKAIRRCRGSRSKDASPKKSDLLLLSDSKKRAVGVTSSLGGDGGVVKGEMKTVQMLKM